MLKLQFERRTFVRQDVVDDFIIYAVTNDSDQPAELDGYVLKFGFWDIEPKDITGWDGVEPDAETVWLLAPTSTERPSRHWVHIKPRGSIPPQGNRFLGIRVTYQNTQSYSRSLLSFKDRIDLGVRDFENFCQISAVAFVIFAPGDRPRAITSPNARKVSSRLARWEFTVIDELKEDFCALTSVDAVAIIHPSACLVHDAIAELHEVIAMNATEMVTDLARVHSAIEGLRSIETAPEVVTSTAAILELLGSMPSAKSQHQAVLRRALSELENLERLIEYRHPLQDSQARQPAVQIASLNGDLHMSSTNVTNSRIGGNVGSSNTGDAATGTTSNIGLEAGGNITFTGNIQSGSPPTSASSQESSKRPEWLTAPRATVLAAALGIIGLAISQFINKLPQRAFESLISAVIGP